MTTAHTPHTQDEFGRQAWRGKAACLDIDPEWFFPVGATGQALAQIEQAKAVCRRCPVIDECLEWALQTKQNDGVWGGMSEDERRAHRRRRNNAGRNNGTQPPDRD
ncbi:MAG: WhiB family transcriptional regulator [Egibacteraceae bacterium]